MINVTKELLDYLKMEPSKQELEVIDAYANLIEVYGGPEDGEAVGNYLLVHQGNICFDSLYVVVQKWGNRRLAERFFELAIVDGKLKEGFDLEILEVLGKFQLEEARPVLVEYALGESDYYTNLHAVRGLLHYNCEDLQDRICTAIEAVYNQFLFNELVPSLVCKLQDRAEVLEKLYITGSQYCSSDCNAGIFLGFSLCGNEGLPYFKKALYDPIWEAHYPSRRYVLEGMRNLGITFSELFQEIQNFVEVEKQRYGLQLLFSLLEEKIGHGKMEEDPRESFSGLNQEFFKLKGGNYSGDLAVFAEKFGETEKAYRLEELLRLRLREEAIFKCFPLPRIPN